MIVSGSPYCVKAGGKKPFCDGIFCCIQYAGAASSILYIDKYCKKGASKVLFCGCMKLYVEEGIGILGVAMDCMLLMIGAGCCGF
jgi:hypothetical protein